MKTGGNNLTLIFQLIRCYFSGQLSKLPPRLRAEMAIQATRKATQARTQHTDRGVLQIISIASRLLPSPPSSTPHLAAVTQSTGQEKYVLLIFRLINTQHNETPF